MQSRFTDRQKYYLKAKGLPLFYKNFSYIDYKAWTDRHEKAFLISINKKEVKGIEDYEKFTNYLRIAAEHESTQKI